MDTRICQVTPLMNTTSERKQVRSNMYSEIKNNQLNFKARNPEIRKFDDMMRQVNLRFPMFSCTKIATFDAYKKQMEHFDPLYKRIADQIIKNRNDVMKISDIYINITKALYLIDKHRVGNCHEKAFATWVGLMGEGYENCHIINLQAMKKNKKGAKRPIDHDVVAILARKHNCLIRGKAFRFDEKDIIIDTWLGKVDYWYNLKDDYGNKKIFERGLKENEQLGYILG